MNLELQVVNLDLAKKLKDLGVKQESYFYWEGYYPVEDYKFHHIIHININNKSDDDFPRYSAFTVAELLELLPHRITTNHEAPYDSYRIRMEKGIWSIGDCCDTSKIKFTEFYSVNYYCDTTSQELNWTFSSIGKNVSDENCANALAKMLIYLLENGLIENVK